MGNPDHLKELLKGVEHWNAWRAEQDKDFRPDFFKSDLRQAFIDAGIIDKRRSLPLEEANLAGAILRGANLTRANLTKANLGGANLRGADLARAGLWGANLSGANVQTIVKYAIRTNDRLPEVTDLRTVRNLRQSQLDTMDGDSGTILPDHLTRPADWPDFELPEDSLDTDDPPASDQTAPFVFLSYASANRETVREIRKRLRDAGLTVWWDQDIAPGAAWRETIADHLQATRVVLTLWTAESTTSKAVIEEASVAQTDRKLVHARLDAAKLPYGFGETQYIDFRAWNGTPTDPVFLKLLQALQDRITPPSAEEISTRLTRTSPLAYVVRDQKLSPVDTPPNTAPPVENAEDLTARLRGLQQSLDRVIGLIANRDAYQLPEDLRRRLDGLLTATHQEPLTWYALDDAREALHDCMADHFADDAWNPGVVRDLKRIDGRIGELQPLLQPWQIPAGAPDAKPPETEPVVREADVEDLAKIAAEAQELLNTDEAKAILDEAAADTIAREAVLILEAKDRLSPDPTPRFERLRRGLKRLTYAVGGLTAAVTGGVAVNLLTAPDAAATLALRLQPILDRLIQFFL